jgi:cyclic pyranopterin phosphate synthase
VNVSIDSLDPARFAALTRRGDLARVIAGVDAARAAGLRVKINAVALGETAGEIPALCAFSWERGMVTRFIEPMPMSAGLLYRENNAVAAADIRQAVERAFGPIEAAPRKSPHEGPSRYWRLAADPAREVGIISAVTEHFCDSCNRLRITATGELHACLGHDDATSLRDILRANGSDDDLERAIAASVGGKRQGHGFLSSGAGGPTKHMVSMGG